MVVDIVKVFLPVTLAFVIGIALAPLVSYFLYKFKVWKKRPGKGTSVDGGSTPVFDSLHATREVGTPKMGGIVIWLSSLLTVTILWLIARVYPYEFTQKIDFLSRNQTWLPLFTLVGGALVGLVDDYLDVRGNGDHKAGGLSLTKRLYVVAAIALVGALWFYFKLGVFSIGLPSYTGVQELPIGWLFIPFFVAVVVFLYSGGVIDGLDGLAGGIFAVAFSAYAGIAFFQGQINLAAFSAMVAGSILAFLWFNIPPARFYMSETGTMALTMTLAVIAFMTDIPGDGHGILALPIIAFPLVATSFSDIIQIASKRLRGGKKVLRIAPLHHHFEAIGWPAYKVTMRYWVIAIVCAIIGMIFALMG